ncbi:MAG: hypothetical protein KDA69_17820 [Planctomycetaceae bacterium]|nr:hypothetical protein [Planctomycetaceae bacterium]
MSLHHLAKLKKLMPPLDPPPENLVDWALAEEVFSLQFPTDFKQLVATYGNVIWCDLFRPIYPETDTLARCEASKNDVLETMSLIFSDELYDTDGNAVQLAPYPQLEGLLPCLTDTNSSFVCWHMKGNPDEWKLVQWYSGTVRFLNCDITQLICDWISQTPPFEDVWGTFFLGPKKYGIAR